jgi:hypothetical protein
MDPITILYYFYFYLFNSSFSKLLICNHLKRKKKLQYNFGQFSGVDFEQKWDCISRGKCRNIVKGGLVSYMQKLLHLKFFVVGGGVLVSVWRRFGKEVGAILGENKG